MSGFGGLDLFELFRAEIETHGAALNAGLLELEAAPADPAPLAGLMRAAHSIKGAARVVGIDAVVSLAHAMEDAIVRIQRGAEACSPPRLQLLLQGTDMLTSLVPLRETDVPAWTAERAGELNALVTALAAASEAAPPSSPTPAAMVPSPSAPATTPRPDAGLAVPASASEARPRPAELPSTESRTVRVNADNLDRMMRLAGESMVEGRRVAGVQVGMRDLRSRFRAMRNALDRDGSVPESFAGRFAALEQAFIRHATALEAAFRRTEEVGERLYHEVIGSRMRPFGDATAGFPRMVRDLGRTLGKQVRLELEGLPTPVDRDILSRLDAPLNHLLRNALDHGVEPAADRRAAGKAETATVRLEARHHAGMLEVRVRDDGHGIDPERLRAKVVERGLQPLEVAAGLSTAELLEFLFLPGFSTAGAVTEVSGRGVGLDVVHQAMREIGGTVRIESEIGRGTAFVLALPVTLSVIRAALVSVAGETLAFPLARIDRIVRVPEDALARAAGRVSFDLDGQSVGVLRADELLALSGDHRRGTFASVLVLGGDREPCGLLVEDFLGERDLVVRPLDARLGRVPHVAAAAIGDEGVPLLVMDVEDILVSIRRGLSDGSLRGLAAGESTGQADGRKRVLVADDSATVREVQRQLLVRAGFRVEAAVDGMDAWNRLRAGRFDMLVTDVDMPRMDGLELVRTLRRDPRFARLPVAVVSYKDRPEDREAGLLAGANAYLTKAAFRDRTFLDAVHDLIGEAAR